MQAALVVFIAAVIGFGAFFITKRNDSPVEQAAEAVIDYELGLPPGAVDLTPEVKK